MSLHHRIESTFHQLRDRKVLKVAAVYAVVAWILMQIGEVAFDPLQLPSWALTLLVVLLVLGFPVAMVLAWALEITPEGIRRDSVTRNLAGNKALADPDAAVTHTASIAVLPFEDMSEGQDQGYFCEGIAEEILNALCRIDELHVTSRVLSFEFGHKQADIHEVGRKLNVETVLEGSVRKAGDLLRITAQLVNTSDGFHLWSQQFDRELEDIFEIQSEIARSIARTLKVTLIERQNPKALTTDPLAYDFFLRGLSFFARHDKKHTGYARQMFRRSIEMDPDYGRAWAGLAYTYGLDYLYFDRREELLEKARRTSSKALSLSPELAESHIARAMAHTICKEYDQATREYEQAIRLDPNSYDAWYFFARSKVHEGEPEHAIRLFRRASEVRPDDYQSLLIPSQLFVSLGDQEGAMRTLERALTNIKSVLDVRPGDTRAWNLGAFALVRLGRVEEGTRWMNTSLENAPEDAIVTYNAACFHSLAGNLEQSLDYLQRCVDTGGANKEWLLQDSDLDAVRKLPLFKQIVDSIDD